MAGLMMHKDVKMILEKMGEDVSREGLLKTPERVEALLKGATSGYKTDVEALVNDAVYYEDVEDIVVIQDIEFSSLCEHHLIPFFGKIQLGYIPNKKRIQLSKIPQIVHAFSKRLQLQERLTHQVADILWAHLQPKGVAVIIDARHMCMEMRGVKKHDTWTTTSMMRGIFKEDEKARNEIMQLHNLK